MQFKSETKTTNITRKYAESFLVSKKTKYYILYKAEGIRWISDINSEVFDKDGTKKLPIAFYLSKD